MRAKLDIGGGARTRTKSLLDWDHLNEPWIVIDLDRSVRPDIVANAESLPFRDGSADEVWASHVLEHFSQNSSSTLLKEWSRVLKIDGKITIYVPNPVEAFHRWSKGQCDMDWLNVVVFGYDPDASPFMAHKCMFFRGSLRNLMSLVGFTSLEYLKARGGARGTWEEFGYRARKG